VSPGRVLTSPGSEDYLGIPREVAREKGVTVRGSKTRVRVEMAITAVAGILGILTVFWRDWIEALTGWDPDQHNGGAEWLIVAGLLAVAAVMGLVTRRHWKLLAAGTDD
jgi:hypothetical protein